MQILHTSVFLYPSLVVNKQFLSLLLTSFSKRVVVHSLSNGNEFDLQDIERARKRAFPYERLCTKGSFETMKH